jgi:hypothetical protein
MGLQKEITDNKGIKACYWNVGYYRVDRKLKFVDCRMYGYPSREEYEKGSDPIMVRPERCIWTNYEQFFSTEKISADGNNEIKAIYDYIHAKSVNFKDAVDVLEPVRETDEAVQTTDTINESEVTA